MNRFKRKQQ